MLYVDNDIEVSQEVTERVSPALERTRAAILEVVRAAPLLGVALLVLLFFWGLARVIVRYELPIGGMTESPFVRNVIRQIIAILVFLIGVLFVLDLFEVTTLVSAVLGTAGAIGLVLGFAFRAIAENYLASILLSLQQPFDRNDLVEVNGYEGKIVRLTTRATVMMTREGNHVQIPNSTVYKSTVYNFTRKPRRRFTLKTGIGTDEDLVDAQQIGLDTLREANVVLDDPEPYSTVEELADSTVVAYHGWIDQREYDRERVKSEALRRLKRVLDAAGIEMPEPTYRVLTAQLSEEPDEEAERRERATRELEQPGMDIEVEPGLDDQIEADRQHSDEPDLLSS
ncbi:MAG: mechanosensitive ion channel family protein [Bradymonadaceae bacterium]